MNKIILARENFEEQVEFFKGTEFIPYKDDYNNINYRSVEGYVGRIPYFTDIVIKTDDNEVMIVDDNTFNYLNYYFENEISLDCKIVEEINKKIYLLNELRKSNEIILGDTVVLKSGSMLMTVKEIIDDNIICSYLLNDEFKEITLKKHQLKLCNEKYLR